MAKLIQVLRKPVLDENKIVKEKQTTSGGEAHSLPSNALSQEEETIFFKLIDAIDSRMKLGELSGEWVSKRSGYEKAFCKTINWNFVNKSHYDAECPDLGLQIEIKKCTSSLWLNLSKYVEHIDRMHTTLVLLYKPGGDRIVDFLLIPTFRIQEKLVGSRSVDCKLALDLIKSVVPRGSQNMVALTKSDLIKLAV